MNVEIPLRRKYRAASPSGPGGMYYLGKKQKGGHNNQGTKGAQRKARPPLPKGYLEDAHEVNETNQRVLVILPSMKRRWMTVPEYEAWEAERHAR